MTFRNISYRSGKRFPAYTRIGKSSSGPKSVLNVLEVYSYWNLDNIRRDGMGSIAFPMAIAAI
ncbi:MAG: hypothetical protein QXU18_00195 [Thermoplasmatales archaeon]